MEISPQTRADRLPIAARRHRLVTEVGRRLADRCGVGPSARIAVGVSGGGDSVSLLLACLALSGRRDGPSGPVAVHVNHHLRESAHDDETFVTDLCARFGIPLRTRHVHPDRLAGNAAARARQLRYDALVEAAREAGAPFVAVAHQAEDQLETLLMAVGRGAGLDGLSSMPWNRRLADGVQLVRPLLEVRRADCESMCGAAGVTWRDDPTNADPATVRARLRREVLPVFEELWPDAASRAAGVAEVIAAARAALQHHVDASFGDESARAWPRAELRALPVPVIAAGLRRAAVAAVPEALDEIGRAHLVPAAEAIAGDGRAPKTFEWPHGITIEITAREVLVVPPNATKRYETR